MKILLTCSTTMAMASSKCVYLRRKRNEKKAVATRIVVAV